MSILYFDAVKQKLRFGQRSDYNDVLRSNRPRACLPPISLYFKLVKPKRCRTSHTETILILSSEFKPHEISILPNNCGLHPVQRFECFHTISICVLCIRVYIRACVPHLLSGLVPPRLRRRLHALRHRAGAWSRPSEQGQPDAADGGGRSWKQGACFRAGLELSCKPNHDPLQAQP